MALDVHTIPIGLAAPVTGSYAGFGFASEHEDLFSIVDLTPTAFPQLSRMRDYYDDTVYNGDDLAALIDEIRTVLAEIERDTPLDTTLSRFLKCAELATGDNKAVLLFAD